MLYLLGGLLQGCKKHDIVEPTLAKDRWQLVSPPQFETETWYFEGKLFFMQNGQLFFVSDEAANQSSCWCGYEGAEEWTEFSYDSANASSLYGQVHVRQDALGNIWVYRSEHLIKISGCGTNQTYKIMDKDTVPITDLLYRFWDMEVIDGVPWLLHGAYGAYRFDEVGDTLVHVPVTMAFPGDDLADIGPYSFLGVGPQNRVLLTNHEHKMWISDEGEEFYPAELTNCLGCRYTGLQVAPNGECVVMVEYPSGGTEMVNLNGFGSVPEIDTDALPYFFNRTKLDKQAQFAYFSSSPTPESFIAFRQQGDPIVVNVKDAVEEGNVAVKDIGWSASEELYVASSRGIFKYLGRDE